MIVQQYPATPARVSGEIFSETFQLRHGSHIEVFTRDHDFGFRKPWIPKAVFVARLTIPGADENDIMRVSIESRIAGNHHHPIISFPVWRVTAAEAAETDPISREWIAVLTGTEPTTENAPSTMHLTPSVPANAADNSNSSIRQRPITGSIRAIIQSRIVTAGFNADLKIWMEGYAPVQGMNWQ